MNNALYTLEKYLVSLVDIELANINENGEYVDIKEGVVKPTRVKK